MTKIVDYKATALNAGMLNKFTKETVSLLAKVDLRKHQNAVMAVFHAAQYGECHALNVFYNALKVNDQTALKAWIVEHFSYAVEGDDTPRHWIGFTNKKNAEGNVIGFRVIKGVEDKRKDVYEFDDLMALKPFFDKDVSKPKAWDVNALLDVIIKAAETIEKKGEKENITLPEDVTKAIQEAKRLAILRHVEEASEVVANENNNQRVKAA